MNPDIKKRWVEALRSGEYKQGRLQLKDGDTFCCLGVLTDLATKDGVCRWATEEETRADAKNPPADVVSSWEAWLPAAVAEWAGLPSHAPAVKLADRRLYLSVFNDGTPTLNQPALDFSTIADLIEEQL